MLAKLMFQTERPADTRYTKAETLSSSMVNRYENPIPSITNDSSCPPRGVKHAWSRLACEMPIRTYTELYGTGRIRGKLPSHAGQSDFLHVQIGFVVKVLQCPKERLLSRRASGRFHPIDNIIGVLPYELCRLHGALTKWPDRFP